MFQYRLLTLFGTIASSLALPTISNATAVVSSTQSTCVCGIPEALTLPHTNLSRSGPLDECFAYRILDARGTMEQQGVSLQFQSLITRVLANRTGGLSQPIVYPASVDQNNTLGIQNLLDSLDIGTRTCPEQKYILLGYSQGASLILEASKSWSKKTLEMVKAVVLVGNPYRIPGQRGNVDREARRDLGGLLGLFANQALASGSDIPKFSDDILESGKVLDYCLEGDGICAHDPACSCPVPLAHLTYGSIESVQSSAFDHIINALA